MFSDWLDLNQCFYHFKEMYFKAKNHQGAVSSAAPASPVMNDALTWERD